MMGRPLTQQQISLKPITPETAFDLLDNEMKSRIFQDFDSPSIMPRSNMYVGCALGGCLIGFFALREVSKGVVEIHINIIKEKRGYAGVFAKKILTNLFSDPLIKRVESYIPVIYPDMLKFVQKLGFIEEGEKRKSFLKNGKWHNLKTIGILREDYGC